ncbi:peptidase [Cronbergia sp. UHCC 0137]|uniref:peptidase n=1 Tax=Cronbergia sp. UHCC 0137 TaxID=3110239 RepID=UPI002B1FB13C|nr:peptidase [Cronbergia sp. UHCC 0137]MEA5616551.1 peptidase [Cronbergia sp. UHCC 0137]
MGKITQRLLAVLILAISTGLLVIFTNFHAIAVFDQSETLIQKSHPLPSTLAQWEDKTNSSDYFEQIKPTPVGYLIWSRFPVRVKVETPRGINQQQGEIWVKSVLQAIEEWDVYLPLQVVEQREIADITIVRKAPALQVEPNSKIPRARSALTTYELYTENNILSHRFTILLSPSQTGDYLKAAARHEIGHALGIWGHSSLPTDALYFSQVRNPPNISARDVNTLKRVYEQPTNLGWPISEKS